MALDLPEAIAGYFGADRTDDPARVAQWFTATAVVKDEGETYSGRDAIRVWKASSSTKYSYTAEPFRMTQDAGRIHVTSHLEGNFPGSPVDLRYIFELEGGKIAALEIVP